MHLVVFIIRIYHDARSSKCQSQERNASRTFGRAIITLPQLCTFSTSLHWSAVAWQPCHSSHCPAVFSHLGLSALSFPHGKIGGAFRKKKVISFCVNLMLRISSDASVLAFYFAALFREKQQEHAYTKLNLRQWKQPSFGVVVITPLRVPQITGSNSGLVILTGYRYCGLYPTMTPWKFFKF